MKSISFDFWGTLCVGNPEFKKRQGKLLSEYDLNLDGKFWQEAKNKIKKRCDELAETRGGQEVLYSLYREILPHFSHMQIQDFLMRSNALFIKYPPINTELVNFVDYLKNNNWRVYVSSNTVFIGGQTLSEVIYDKFGIIKTNCNFSDELQVAKPHSSMFEFPIKPSFHVGDNKITDGKCIDYGIKYLPIETNNINVNDLIKLINV